MPQKRKRVYILAYSQGSKLYDKLSVSTDYLKKDGVLCSAFGVSADGQSVFNRGKISKNIAKVSKNFNKGKDKSPFYNSGVMKDGRFLSCKLESDEKIVYSNNQPKYIKDIMIKNLNGLDEFIIDKNKPLIQKLVKQQIDGSKIIIKTELDLWRYLKGKKSEIRVNKIKGFKYKYGEGKMSFPDNINDASRTIITGEGGVSPSRFKHVIIHGKDKDGDIYRRLTPLELERLNMFPDNHTKDDCVSNTKRAFFMGNALVVGVVEKIARELAKHI